MLSTQYLKTIFLQLLDDFTKEFSGKENNLFSNIALAKENIIKIAKLKFRKLIDKNLKENYRLILKGAEGESHDS